MAKKTKAERLKALLARVTLADNGCWEYTGPRRGDGYGHFWGGGAKLAHRAAYVLAAGEIPKGMCVMHTCDNPSCCNPAHLKLGTKADNNRDMFTKRRNGYNPAHYTRCKNGHEFTPENTRVTRDGFRACKVCARIRQRINAGWTKEQAESLPLTPHGHRPIGGHFSSPIKPPPQSTFSTRGSAPRQRAWRARQKALREAQVRNE